MDIIAIMKANKYTNKKISNISVPGGTLNYENLTNLPQLDSLILKGNTMLATLGYTKFTNDEVLKKFDVNSDGELIYDNNPISGIDSSKIDYTKLLNLPSINNKTLTGNIDITEFDNEEVLKKINIDTDGKMTYDNKPISTDVEVPIENIEVNGTTQTPVNKTVSITVPTKTSELTNDSNYVDDTHTHKLIDMSDVDIATSTDGDVISYDAVKQKYVSKQVSTSDEKVKMDSVSDSKYLNELIDKLTIQISDGTLVVKTIDGLTVTTTELNTLKGMTENVKSILSSIGTGGMVFKGTAQTKADLVDIESPANGEMYIVLTDESSDTKTDTVTYVYSDADSNWLKIGLTNIVVRDFTTNPIDLSTEVTGVLPIEKVNSSTLATKDDLKNYYSKDDIDGESFVSKSDLSNYYTKSDMDTELLSYAKSVDLTTHENDTTLHITSAERTKWNSYTEFSGDYNDLINKPTIPTVTNDLTDALKSSYDSAVTNSHTHDNKDVLDKLSTSDGNLLFDGKEISSSGTTIVTDSIFTDEWKANTSYKVDDIVKYNYKDYKCTTAHTSSTTFDDTNWTFVKYSELHVYSVTQAEYNTLVSDGTITDDTKDLYVIDGNTSGGGSSSGSSGEAVWGSITGTLTDQVDLKNILDTKADITHTHVVADITDFPTSLPANGGNADTLDGKSPSDFADVNHTHTEVNGHTVDADVPSDAVFTDTVYDDTELKNNVNRINYAQKTVNDLGSKSLIESPYSFTVSVPTSNGTLANTAIEKDLVLNDSIFNYDSIEILFGSCGTWKRVSKATKFRVNTIGFDNSSETPNSSVTTPYALVCNCSTPSGDSDTGIFTFQLVCWFKDDKTLHLHMFYTVHANSSFSNFMVEDVVGVNDKSVIIDPVEYVNSKTGIEDTPVGHIISTMSNSAPKHYLICDGTEYNISDYPYLSEHIKTEFGSYNYFGGDGTSTFAVPDLRGEFLRGTGTATRNTGSGAAVGVHQDPTEIPYYWHNGSNNFSMRQDGTTSNILSNMDVSISSSSSSVRNYYYKSSSNASSSSSSVTAVTARPTNTSVLYCIKYEPTYFMKHTYGTNTIYSNNEMIVGKWIDGKPLYKTTITTNTPSVDNTMSDVITLDTTWECVDISGSLIYSDSCIPINWYLSSTNYISTWIRTIDNSLRMQVSASRISKPVYITILYTKTTDTASSVSLSSDVTYTDEEVSTKIDEVLGDE